MVMMGVQVRAMIRREPRYLQLEASLEAGIVWRSRNWKVAEREINAFVPAQALG